MITNYTGQRWRYLTAFAEGTVWMLVVMVSLIYKYVSQTLGVMMKVAQSAYASTAHASSTITNGWFLGDDKKKGYLGKVVNLSYVEETIVYSTERLERDGDLEHVERQFKFYERGLTQAIVAFVCVPILLAIGIVTMEGFNGACSLTSFWWQSTVGVGAHVLSAWISLLCTVCTSNRIMTKLIADVGIAITQALCAQWLLYWSSGAWGWSWGQQLSPWHASR